MASKTFIKVKRGLIAPEHRVAIGDALWLYMVMLDRADWKTGIIYDWKDKEAAEHLGLSLPSIRQQRKKLEGKYIEVLQKQQSLQIKILNWNDPSQKWNAEDKKESINILTPSEKESLNILIPSNGEGVNILTPSSPQGDSHGDRKLTPFLLIKNIRIKELRNKNNDEKYFSSDDLIKNFLSISKIENPPKSLAEISAWKEVLMLFQRSGATNEILSMACQEARASGKIVASPESIISECTKLIQKKIAS